MIGGYVTDKIDSGGEWEYVLPIYVDNLTITKENSVGDVVLTNTATPSSDYGGMWNYQNFITITGNCYTACVNQLQDATAGKTFNCRHCTSGCLFGQINANCSQRTRLLLITYSRDDFFLAAGCEQHQTGCQS